VPPICIDDKVVHAAPADDLEYPLELRIEAVEDEPAAVLQIDCGSDDGADASHVAEEELAHVEMEVPDLTVGGLQSFPDGFDVPGIDLSPDSQPSRLGVAPDPELTVPRFDREAQCCHWDTVIIRFARYQLR